MASGINSTEEYHQRELDSLGWELTVCNSLHSPDSPCRKVLRHNRSFGESLHSHLSTFIDFNEIRSVLEVGGGYGFLMKDLLRCAPRLKPVMMDISPVLLEKQRLLLGESPEGYVRDDFFRQDASFFKSFDLVILNEVVGDFPVVVDLVLPELSFRDDTGSGADSVAIALIQKYSLEVPRGVEFHFNAGAVRAVETLCTCGLRTVFVSEHSCEARTAPAMKGLMEIPVAGFPERIHLKGHDEYTVKFSHLEAVATAHGYRTTRGQYIDFLEPVIDERLRFILTSGASTRDEYEIIRHFMYDIQKYEYMVFMKQ
jgi:hypothetical protein